MVPMAQHLPGALPGPPSPPGLGSRDDRGMHRCEWQLLQLLDHTRSRDQGHVAQVDFQVRQPALHREPLQSKTQPQVRPIRTPTCNGHECVVWGLTYELWPVSRVASFSKIKYKRLSCILTNHYISMNDFSVSMSHAYLGLIYTKKLSFH